MIKKVLFIGILIVIATGIWSSNELTYAPESDPLAFATSEQIMRYREYRKAFSEDRETIAIALEKKDTFSSVHDFRKVHELTEAIKQVPGVSEVNSIENFDLPYFNGFFSSSERFLPTEDPAVFRSKFDNLNDYSDITEKFLSADRTALCFYLFTKEGVENSEVIRQVYQLLDESDFAGDYYVAGTPAAREEGERLLVRETLYISVLGCLLILACMLFVSPNFYRIALTLLFTVFNICMTILFMYVANIEVTSLSSAVPSIVAILSFTDITHILYHYNKLKKQGLARKTIRKELFRKIGLPLLLTSATNLAGFVIFFFNGGIELITELALAASFGIVCAYCSSRFLLPFFLNYNENNAIERRQNQIEKFVSVNAEFVRRNHNRIVLLFILLLPLLAGGVVWYQSVDMYYYDKNDLDLGLNRSSAFYDSKFQGIRDIEVVLETGEGDLLSPRILRKIDSVEQFLLQEYGCKTTFSINTAIKRHQRYTKGGNPEAYRLPDTITNAYKNELFKWESELGLRSVISEDGAITRIIGSLPDIGTREARIRNQSLEGYVSQLNSDDLSAYLSGKAYIFDHNVYKLSRFVLWALGFGLVLVAIIVGVLFRSVVFAVVTFLANTTPLLFGIMVMMFFGINLNPGSIFILTIILGIALDDSIYILGHFYKVAEKEGISEESLIKSLKSNSLPLFSTSVVLSISFLALVISSYYFTAAFGIIIAASLIFAFITDILFMPSMILQKIKRKRK